MFSSTALKSGFRTTITLFVLWITLLTALPTLAAEISENSPRALVHLLDYLASDYAGAVSADGKVISQSEFQEQNEFAEAAEGIATKLYAKDQPKLIADLAHIRDLIRQKASPEDVRAGALAAKAEAIRISGLPVAPVKWPSLKRGEQVYAQSCVQCHGQRADGKGSSAGGMNPPPISFYDEARMAPLSPFQIFNSVRIGVPGTAMVGHSELNDDDVWNVAFYVNSLRHRIDSPTDKATSKNVFNAAISKAELEQVASENDSALAALLPGNADQKKMAIAVLRTHSGEEDDKNTLKTAATMLDESFDLYKSGKFDEAKHRALSAYLEGVEPVEPRLKASDPSMTAELENRMAVVRQKIEGRKSADDVAVAIASAKQEMTEATALLTEAAPSPWLTFTIAAAILLREGFEAVLIVLALLGVVRAAGASKAALWVHAGWIAALALGFVAWFSSGWLMDISGAQREMMEGVTSLLAVAVLLYMGFWLHRTTEIGRWTKFINGKVKTALEGSNLLGLAAISFMAVFREAFETVLFLRALWLEGGMSTKTALAGGVFGSLAFIIIASWIALRYTARIPIRKLFDVSSSLMTVLAVILIGKGIHSLQETGTVGISASPMNFRIDLIGLYPTYETLVAQVVILGLALGLWIYGKRPSAAATARATNQSA